MEIVREGRGEEECMEEETVVSEDRGVARDDLAECGSSKMGEGERESGETLPSRSHIPAASASG